MICLCNDWEFTPDWNTGFDHAIPVRLPHSVKDLPLHCIDSNAYQMLCGYRRRLEIPSDLKGKRLFLQFDGAGHIATVYLNGHELVTHNCGYTGFRVEITDAVDFGGENILMLRLDATENPAIPPFGFVIDYLTYGGLYREVWLDIREQFYIEDIFSMPLSTDTLQVHIKAHGADTCRLSILDEDGTVVLKRQVQTSEKLQLPTAKPWTVDNPYRYTLQCELLDGGNVVDTQSVKFGFRTAEFRADGFYLNGEKVFLRGLNRHQSFPYMGYAASESLQREDARILKEELGCNAVRTSHYPQSHYFIDECDRLGLLVFTEIPGWQHIGDEGWKEQACRNVEEMVLQYRNHPSIVLWGVRINESGDDNELYRRTNAIARKLDPSRATSGVRFLQKSSLLEDVYAYNDFSHMGTNGGAMGKRKVTPDMGKGYLISEHNGHMFPTKAFDPWQKRQEHALRHARVLDAAMASGEHAGCFGWCMFDYATHKDFGSGDRICYHGVMDSFRNPKLAAAVYASQQEDIPVLEVGSPMDIGDYPAGTIGDVAVFTNADTVALYKNGDFVTNLRYDDWQGLTHGPMRLDDLIGCLLETKEGFPKKKASLLRKCLLSAGKHGLAGMPLMDKLKMGYAMLRYKMSIDHGVALYGKYVGNWGGEATVWRFDAIKGNQVVASVTKCPSPTLHLEVKASRTTLTEGDRYDMAAVRIRILDEFNNPVPYAQIPVELKLEGAAELVGPAVVTAEGGMCGTYLRTIGVTGTATLTITTCQTPTVRLELIVQ